ncbi:MAG: diguanylate cyclase, partial [Pseudobutyrivibrio sp.]|nr:diguanylate cyclase [Pseudobutyrivibrio sp.]
FRSSDILCRMGGDEFVAFVELSYESDVELIIDRINSNIADFNAINEQEYNLSISIGYKIFVPTEENVKHLSTLLKEADKMLYENKKAKKQGDEKSE